MARDWRPEIERLVEIKSAIYQADGERLWKYHLPRVAATEEALQAAERALGFALEPQFREFLGYADGWPAFHQTVDLFGTDDLTGGPRHELGQQMLSDIEPFVWADIGFDGTTMSVIAATSQDLDLFVLPVMEGRQQPPVVWLTGHEVDRFESFEEYIHAMIGYNLRELDRVTGRL